jgi:uncharacterized membrane protein
MNSWIWVALLAVLPISELRGAIPYGVISGLPIVPVIIISIIFNVIVFFIVMFFLTYIHKGLCNIKLYKKIVDRFLERVHRRAHKKVAKYGYWGLTIFVAIPLPITGAYTGSIAAWILGMDKKRSFLAVVVGVLIAAAIVTAVVLSGAGIFNVFVKA